MNQEKYNQLVKEAFDSEYAAMAGEGGGHGGLKAAAGATVGIGATILGGKILRPLGRVFKPLLNRAGASGGVAMRPVPKLPKGSYNAGYQRMPAPESSFRVARAGGIAPVSTPAPTAAQPIQTAAEIGQTGGNVGFTKKYAALIKIAADEKSSSAGKSVAEPKVKGFVQLNESL